MTETLLLIDVGNSALKWRLGAEPTQHGRRPLDAPDSLAVLQNAWANLPRPAEVWLASVAGKEVDEALAALVQRLWALPLQRARVTRRALGVSNGYREPERLGVDRWLAMLAARDLSSEAVLIADCGSAVTLDLIDSDGMHRTGAILPGLGAMRRCLLQGTRIPRQSDQTGAIQLASDTRQAIDEGRMLAICGAIEMLHGECQSKLGVAPLLLLTGGDAPTVADRLRLPGQVIPELVLDGLERVARHQ